MFTTLQVLCISCCLTVNIPAPAFLQTVASTDGANVMNLKFAMTDPSFLLTCTISLHHLSSNRIKGIVLLGTSALYGHAFQKSKVLVVLSNIVQACVSWNDCILKKASATFLIQRILLSADFTDRGSQADKNSSHHWKRVCPCFC